MQRAAIYARFSTDLQNERSIDDQAALCRKYAESQDLTIVATFEDRARSGGSILGRDGLFQLMEQARAGAFEVIVVEALDRLSRDMEDLAGIHKRLSFLGVQIRAVHEGVVNTVLVGLRGLVGQLYREDNAHKVRRGLAGRVDRGLNAGGLTYGYAPMAGEPGRRAIVETEAEIVRRIFREYAAGRTPRDIAHDLNRDGVAPPRGRAWNASTINGNSQRGTGILHNELYVGRLVWNKVRMVKNPDTGRRVSRPNLKEVWHTAEVPDLAIVPGEDPAARATPPAPYAVWPSQVRLLRCRHGNQRQGQVRPHPRPLLRRQRERHLSGSQDLLPRRG
jgi:DNA invertase Pin-like site-specific DNA recombinase